VAEGVGVNVGRGVEVDVCVSVGTSVGVLVAVVWTLVDVNDGDVAGVDVAGGGGIVGSGVIVGTGVPVSSSILVGTRVAVGDSEEQAMRNPNITKATHFPLPNTSAVRIGVLLEFSEGGTLDTSLLCEIRFERQS
jgi:hypothetical protein